MSCEPSIFIHDSPSCVGGDAIGGGGAKPLRGTEDTNARSSNRKRRPRCQGSRPGPSAAPRLLRHGVSGNCQEGRVMKKLLSGVFAFSLIAVLATGCNQG